MRAVPTSLTLATNNGDIAGGEVMLLALAEAARDLNCAVTVVAPTGPSELLDAARAAGFATVAITATTRPAYARGLRAWDAAERTGLLWCNGLVPALATAGHPDRVVHLHQLPRGRAQRVAALLARVGARRVVVPSRTMAADVPGSTPLPNWCAEVVLPSGSHHRDPDAVTLGYLGRHSTDKGVDVLARALALLDRRTPGRYRLLLAGESRFVDEADALRVRDALDRVAPLVERAGWIGRADFFAAIDLAVFPSVWAEPFGLVVTEAQSARVPFVVTDAGALPEVAGPGYPWIARAGDPASLADTIERALAEASPAHLDAARDRWRREYSPEAGRRRLAALLAGLGVRVGGAA